MLSLDVCKSKLTEFKRHFGDEYGIKRIGIFGSVARGEQTENSDLDIVVDVANSTWEVMFNLKERLEQYLECAIDLVRYRQSLRPLLKNNIDKETIYV